MCISRQDTIEEKDVDGCYRVSLNVYKMWPNVPGGGGDGGGGGVSWFLQVVDYEPEVGSLVCYPSHDLGGTTGKHCLRLESTALT